MRLDGREDVTEPVREPEDEVVLELVDSGESGVIVAPIIRQSSHKYKKKKTTSDN